MDYEEQLLREKLNRLLLEEKSLTAQEYSRMSGEIPWKYGEREKFKNRCETIAAQIDKIIHQVGIA